MSKCHAFNRDGKTECKNKGYIRKDREGHAMCFHIWCSTHADNGKLNTRFCKGGLQMEMDLSVPTYTNPKVAEAITQLLIDHPEGDIIVPGTGSRSLMTAPKHIRKLASERLEAILIQLKETLGDRLVVMSGMSEGWDAGLAKACIKHNIRFWAAVPNKGYGNYYWGRKSLSGENRYEQFRNILLKAEKIIFVMEDIHNLNSLYKDGRHSNFIRNDYMVEQGDFFLVWDPSSRGTADCFTSIKRARKPYVVVSAGVSEEIMKMEM